MPASVRSSAAASALGGEGALESRRGAKSTRTANTFGSVVEKSAYNEEGDYYDIPWWDTDFLEPPPRGAPPASARAARWTAIPPTTRCGPRSRTTP